MRNNNSESLLTSNLDIFPIEGTKFSGAIKTINDIDEGCIYSLTLQNNQSPDKDNEIYLIVYNHKYIEDDHKKDKQLIIKQKNGCHNNINALWRYIEKMHITDDSGQKIVLSDTEEKPTGSAYEETTEQKGPYRYLDEAAMLVVMKKDNSMTHKGQEVVISLEQGYYRNTHKKTFTPCIGRINNIIKPRKIKTLSNNKYEIKKTEETDSFGENQYSMEIIPENIDYDTLISEIPEEVIDIMNIILKIPIPKQIRDDFTEMYNISRKELKLKELILF